MSNISTLLKTILFFCAVIAMQNLAGATTYTAIANGNYNSSGTWQGGIAPSFNLVNDIIIIPPGIKVTAGSNISISGLAGGMTVNGDLTGTAIALDMNNATLSGNGNIDIDSFSAMFAGLFDFNGIMDVQKINTTFTGVSGNPTINVSDVFYAHGSMNMNSGNFNVFNNATIQIKGSMGVPLPSPISVSGGAVFNMLASYNVEYIGGSIESGVELSGVGLSDVTVDVGAMEEARLTSDLVLGNGSLILTSGVLNLNNHNLEFKSTGDLDAAAPGEIKSSSSSDIIINKTNPISGALKFTSGGNTVRTLSINTNGNIKLGNALKITKTLDLQLGKLDVNGNKLSLISGAEIVGANSTRYVITSSGGTLSDDVNANDSVTYHVGTDANYAPCKVKSNNNTVYNGLSIKVDEGVKNQGITGVLISNVQPLVNATWILENGTATVVDVDLELMWGLGMEVNSFDRTMSYITQSYGSEWDKQTPKAAVGAGNLYSQKRAGLKNFSAVAVFDKNTVSIQDVIANRAINMYPNPAKDVLYIELKEQAQASIYNTSGQLMQSSSINNNNNAINIANLPKGLYYIQLNSNTVNATGKFMKH